jgi:hypothetical protein
VETEESLTICSLDLGFRGCLLDVEDSVVVRLVVWGIQVEKVRQ